MLLSTHLRRNGSRNPEQGYILLFLLLIIALMAIAMTTLVTSIKFDMKRDREEEMIAPPARIRSNPILQFHSVRELTASEAT